MGAPVPSLSGDGWITDLTKKCDHLLSYFFVSEASQSTLFNGRIASLPAIVQQYGNNDLTLRNALRDTLTSMMGPYFDQIDVRVTVETQFTQQPGRMDVTVAIDVMDNGVLYSVAQLIPVLNSKIGTIMHMNNYG